MANGLIVQLGLAGLLGAALVGGAQLAASPTISPEPMAALAANCSIKGNISINTGEHIYHVPGQKFYPQTKVSPEYGERWFCSEADARKAGWRKARR